MIEESSNSDVLRWHTTIDNELTYNAERILTALRGHRYGRCPCDISTTTGIGGKLFYKLLAELLGRGFVKASTRDGASPQLIEALDQADRIDADDEVKVQAWNRFFHDMANSDDTAITGRYYISMTPTGSQKLSQTVRWKPLQDLGF